MKRQSNLSSLILLTLAVCILSLSGWSQKKKEDARITKTTSTENKDKAAANSAGKVKVSIHEVVKEDARARATADGRVIPVRFVWLCESTNNARLVELEARLITLNTDGKQTKVSKRLTDWTVNKPINSALELPMAKDVFAKNFKLELVGKFHDGVVEHVVSTMKEGNFPLPSIAEQKR